MTALDAVVKRTDLGLVHQTLRSAGGALYGRQMAEPITPKELAAELGVSDRAIRQWLRDQGWQSVPYARWELTQEQAAQVRTQFRA